MIRNIVFDIGRVLINLHFERLEKFLIAHNAACNDLSDFYRLTDMHAFEHGHMNEDDFFRRVQTLFSVVPERAHLHHAFIDIFSANEPILTLTEHLRQDYRLYILSNTNVLHWRYLQETYGLGDRVHGVITSFEAGAMKPAAGIYQLAETRYGLIPHETLFIDDLVENTRGAKARGWRTIHHRDNENTLLALSRLGLV